jgi:hypothetical protein
MPSLSRQRHRRGTVALAQPHPSPIVDPNPRPSALPLNAPVAADGGRLRRCTFRRVSVAVPTQSRGRSLPVYDVACLYPSRESAIPLGDLDSARAICDACAATGIFRPVED